MKVHKIMPIEHSGVAVRLPDIPSETPTAMIMVLFGFLLYLQARDYHQFPGLKKTIERSPFFVLLIFLSGLQKLEQRAKKCIELRGEYVE